MTVKLNSITHKHVVRRVDEIANDYENNGCLAVFIEAGALFESGLDKTGDKVNVKEWAFWSTRLCSLSSFLSMIKG